MQRSAAALSTASLLPYGTGEPIVPQQHKARGIAEELANTGELDNEQADN